MAALGHFQDVYARIAYEQNVLDARALLQSHLIIPGAPLPAGLPPILQVLCLYASFQDAAAILLGAYILLPDVTIGPVPSIANLQQSLHFAVFKVCALTADNMTLQCITTFNDVASDQVALANVNATYGPLNTNLYVAIPHGPQPFRFLVAHTNLRDSFALLDPALHPPAAAAMMAPAGAAGAVAAPPDQIMQMHMSLIASGKTTVDKERQLARLNAYARVHPPGTFDLALASCMFALPAGQQPSAAYFSLSTINQAIRDDFYDKSQFKAAKTVTISPPKLDAILLFDFTKATLDELATPADIPLNFNTAKKIVKRFTSVLARLYGVPIGVAVENAMDTLVDLQENDDSPHLTPSDCLLLIQRRLYNLPQDPVFDVTKPPNGKTLEENLETYLRFTGQSPDLVRVVNAHLMSELDSIPAANPKPSNRKRSLPAAAATAPPTTRTTRSATLPDAANAAKLKLWHELLIAEVGELKDVELPCLYFFAGLVPCHGHRLCQKKTHKKPHVVHPLVKKHELVVKNWLKLDPLGRF